MAKGENFETEPEPSSGGPRELRPRASGEVGASHTATDAASTPPRVPGSPDPVAEGPGRFSGSQPRAGTPSADKFQGSGGKTATQKHEDVAQFHDSHSEEDIYDLYNACNGILVNGFLDVSRLDTLSPEEKDTLDVRRLREIWKHTRTGCARCATIVRTLNQVRERLRGRMAEKADGRLELVDVNIKDLIG